MVQLMDSLSTISWMTEQDSVKYEVRFDLSKGGINYDSDSETYGQENSFDPLKPSYALLVTAHACGPRSFLSEAEACLDLCMLSLTGTIDLG